VDDVSERDRAIYEAGWLAGRAQEIARATLMQLATPMRCPFGDRCACDLSDPSRLAN
jgi:hypothetical protein